MALEDEEPGPRIVARGSWAQDDHGDLIYGPEGLPPRIVERLTEATDSLWSEGAAEGGRGYRIRTGDLWDQAKIDYLAGDTAEAVCDRYGLKVGTLKDRARKGGWRRADQADPEPVADARETEAGTPPPDYGDMAARALRQADRALVRGRAAEAASWLRLHARLVALSAPPPGRTPPAPRPARTPDAFDAANIASRAAIALAGRLGRTDPSDPLARAALDARFDALTAGTSGTMSDDSDDSDPLFSAAGSEPPPADPTPPNAPPRPPP